MSQRERIYLSPPHMGGREFKFVQEAFDTNWISPAGPHLVAFEKELAAYAGVDHCAVLSSGTAAIHLALILLDVKRDDEVICSTFTFSASCNPIVYQGAHPVFVDSERDTWNMDPQLLEEAILDRIKKKGKAPKAVIVVHLYGMPSKMDEVGAVCLKYGIPVIEDAAEALGSAYKGRRAGTLGDIGVFSFNGNKIITTSGGGALVSSNRVWIEKARHLATQARDAAPHYQHSEIGYNYRLSNVCAGIGRGQLQEIDTRVKQRRDNFEFYKNAFKDLHAISFQPEPDGFYANRWLTSIVIDPSRCKSDREGIRLALEGQNIESRPLWKPMHQQPVFKDFPVYGGAVSASLFEMGLCLPSGSSLTETQRQEIAAVVKRHL
jgi:dTDP-4-amino-4,6-dideoxygalactose transaminase